MLRKFSLAKTGLVVFLLTTLISCQENVRNVDDGTGIQFDTTRAAKSVIPISQAIALQQNFISSRTALSRQLKDSSFLTKSFNLPNGEAFSRDAILLLLSQKGADGIRIYYGKDSTTGEVRLVLLPVTKDGKVIYNRLITSSTSRRDTANKRDSNNASPRSLDVNDQTDEEAVETGQTCPPCLINSQQQ